LDPLTDAAHVALVSPLSGLVVPLDRVPDAVFAQRTVGDGLAIEPLSGELLAPCDGVVSLLHRAGHAVTVTAANGAEILMHIGIDTVNLEGRGFSARVSQGARVRAGEVLIAFDADRVARQAKSLQTMIVLTNEGYGIAWRAAAGDALRAGSSLLMNVAVQRAATATLTARGAVQEWSAVAVVGHVDGIHARPAALVQAAARGFEGEVVLEVGGRTASTKSVVALMSLGARHKDRVSLRALGEGGQAVLARVVLALETATPSEHAAKAPAPAATAGKGLRGVTASPGIARGQVVRLDAATPEPPAHTGNLQAERDRLAAAIARVDAELDRAVREADARGVPQQSAVLATHKALLDDPEIASAARTAVERGESAGAAFRSAVRAQCDALSALGNALIAERAADLREIERRVIGAMTGAVPEAPPLFERSIIVADDIGVAELSRLAPERVAGLCTARGGATSHVAILARALGIPALVAVGTALLRVPHGKEVVLDATAGLLDVDPDAARLEAATETLARRAAGRAAALADKSAPAVTTDGHTIEVAANVATEDDARVAAAHGADSVGLMRTELLFVDRRDEPPVAEQTRAYQSVVDALGGRPGAAIVRTLDAGGDKPLPFLPMPPEENPALGLRGIRAGLVRPEVLDRQLRALLAVRPLSACRIMLPMVSDAAEIIAVRERIETLAREAHLPDRPQLGIMVEVPSAALLADQLAVYADFLSLGTNDLTQYTLAMDRGNPELAARVDGLHPSVLRLVAQTVQGARAHGKWVGVCGALASDLEAVPVLVGLGVSELSVSPRLVPEVKARVRGLDRASCEREARAMLDLPSAAAVRERARTLWPEAR
jgi:phosphocarrier protein FPr/phosphocarrier protein